MDSHIWDNSGEGGVRVTDVDTHIWDQLNSCNQLINVLVNDQREHPSSSSPLILVNDQREHPSSSTPLMSVSQSVPACPTFVTDVLVNDQREHPSSSLPFW